MATRPSGQRRGVAIVMAHGLGDLLLFSGTFHLLRAHYPGEPLLLVCSTAARGYAADYLQPDRILAFDRDMMRRNLLYRLRIMRRLTRARVRVVIQPSYNRYHLVEDALVRVSGAAERIGSAGTPMFMTQQERRRGDGWYTRLIDEASGPLHDTERNAAFAAALTGEAPQHELPRLATPPRHRDAPAGGYLVAACEASAALKTWPADRFIEASQAIAAQTGLTVVLTGRTRPSVPQMDTRIVDLRGVTELPEVIAILAHARIVLCNDSAPAHLATALGVPAVVMAGGGIPDRYLPYPAGTCETVKPLPVTVAPAWACFGCGWHCRYATTTDAAAPCIAHIAPAQAVAAALQLLAAT